MNMVERTDEGMCVWLSRYIFIFIDRLYIINRDLLTEQVLQNVVLPRHDND